MDIFDSLAAAICSSLPQVIASRFSEHELFRLKLWYYDTHAPEYYFLAEPFCVASRDQLLSTATVGEWPLSKIWNNTDPVLKDLVVNDKAIGSSDLFRQVHRWRKSDDSPDNATEILHKFACRVCRQLNAINWNNYLKVDPDFVVYAQNGTDYGVDNYHDLIESVPQKSIARLRARKLFGPGKMYVGHPDYCTKDQWEMVIFNTKFGLHPQDDWKMHP